MSRRAAMPAVAETTGGASVVDVLTDDGPAVVPVPAGRLDEAHARALDERIRLTATTVRDRMTRLAALVEQARAGEVWDVLGYASWTAYLSEALGGQMHLPAAERDVAWNTWIDDHLGLSSRTRDLQKAFNGGWDAALPHLPQHAAGATVTLAYHDSIVNEAQRQIHTLEGRVGAFSQRVSPSVEDVARAVDPHAWTYARYSRDTDPEVWDLYAGRRDRSLQAAERALALLPGPTVEQVRREALLSAADDWQTGGWADDLPKGADRPALILGMAQRATDWLRARAAEAGEP